MSRRTTVTLLILLLLGTFDISRCFAQAVLSVSATVLSRNNCRFTAANATIAFGALDPADGADASASTTIGFRCAGRDSVVTYLIEADSGLHGSGEDRHLQHTVHGAARIPYALTITPATGTIAKNVNQTLTLVGLIRGSDYRLALPGDYADTVLLSINP
jgi:hypothetical protein